MAAKPETIDEYLARLSKEKRIVLEKLRKAIKSAAPKAEEKLELLSRPKSSWLQLGD